VIPVSLAPARVSARVASLRYYYYVGRFLDSQDRWVRPPGGSSAPCGRARGARLFTHNTSLRYYYFTLMLILSKIVTLSYTTAKSCACQRFDNTSLRYYYFTQCKVTLIITTKLLLIQSDLHNTSYTYYYYYTMLNTGIELSYRYHLT
jgi:hypothetical protein